MAIGDKNLISDDFWLNMGAEVVYGSIQVRKDEVDRLQKTIVWVFGIYTSISFASVVFSDKKQWVDSALVLFGIAFLFLILAYWLATVATMSLPEDFYGSAAASVRAAFIKALKDNNRYFNFAVVFSGIGTLLYSLALLTQFSSPVWHKTKEVPKISQISVNAIKIQSGGNTYSFNLTSKKSTWHQVFLVHDTIINKKHLLDTLLPDKASQLKQVPLFTDTSGIAKFTLKDLKYDKGNYLLVFRVDSVKTDQDILTERLKFKIN